VRLFEATRNAGRASVKQPVVAKLLVMFPNPAQMPIAKTQNSAAWNHVIIRAIARNSTSCIFIVRSIAAFE